MNMTSEDTSRTSKPTELSLSEEVQEAKDICQSLHTEDLNKLMQAVKTVMGFDQAEAGHLIGELTEDCVAVRRLK
jgi:hypothetical protein